MRLGTVGRLGRRAAGYAVGGHEAHHTIGDGEHSGGLVQHGRGRVGREHVIPRLARVLDLVGKLATAPRLDAAPAALALLNDLLDSLDHLAVPFLRHIGLDQQHDLVWVDPDHLLWSRAAPAGDARPSGSGSRRTGAGSSRLSRRQYTCALRTGGPVGRARWFIVGAAATAGALVAGPGAYPRLRGLVGARAPGCLRARHSCASLARPRRRPTSRHPRRPPPSQPTTRRSRNRRLPTRTPPSCGCGSTRPETASAGVPGTAWRPTRRRSRRDATVVATPRPHLKACRPPGTRCRGWPRTADSRCCRYR